MPLKFNPNRASAPPSFSSTKTNEAAPTAKSSAAADTSKAAGPSDTPKWKAATMSSEAKQSRMASRQLAGSHMRAALEGKYEFDNTKGKWVRTGVVAPGEGGVQGHTAKLGDLYKGEEVFTKHVQATLPDGSKLKTKYMTDADRAKAEVHVKDGALVDAKGARIDTGKGPHIFAMDEKGRVFAADGDKHNDRLMDSLHTKSRFKNKFLAGLEGMVTKSKFDKLKEGEKSLMHHSSFLAGKDVSAAGELKIADGKLQSISNKSGHYKPQLETTAQALQNLKGKGVDITGTKVEIHSKDGKFTRYAGEVLDAKGNATALKNKRNMLDDLPGQASAFHAASKAAAALKDLGVGEVGRRTFKGPGKPGGGKP